MRYRRLLALLAVTAVVATAAACGEDGEDAAPVEEEPEAVEDDDEDVDVESQEIDETVRYAGYRFEVEDMEVDDVTAMLVELTFNVSVENLGPDSATPRPDVSLQWDDDGDVIQVSGQTDFREIPGESSSSGTIDVSLDQDDLETWDLDTARLVFGSDTEAQALVPIGSDAELVTRERVSQDVDDTFTVRGIEIEILSAEVGWDGVDNHVQAPDGTAVLFFEVDLTSNEDGQVCIETSDWQITLPDGTGRTADFVGERCFPGGEDERGWQLGFEIDDPFEGDYTVMIETSIGGDDVSSNVVEFELVGGDDTSATITDDNDDHDNDNDDHDDDDDNDG